MFILVRNGFSVNEFPIELPARTYGSSKMTAREALRSGTQLLKLCAASLALPARFRVSRDVSEIDPTLIDPQSWDAYWGPHDDPAGMAYTSITAFYRSSVMRPQLERALFQNFPDGSHLLHAGCGGGQVDVGLQRRMRITAVDISPSAVRLYQRNNPAAFEVRHADIQRLPFASESFDGVYNLGVLEHFTVEEIQRILIELHRVLKPTGRLVVFWPHARATSVAVLKAAHWLLNEVAKKPTEFHPPEISLLESRRWVEPLLGQAGFRVIDYSFGPSDFFVQATVVAEKTAIRQ
jgi:ubiquinone/menaquinone biosynthesis C-methylase UbiE